MNERADGAPGSFLVQQRLDLEELYIEFESAWRTSDKPTARIADFVARIDQPQRSRLVEELVAIECELRQAHGQTPSREEYHQRLPDFAGAVEAAFQWRPAADGKTPASGEASEPERLGDYRIVREIGRGGMGIVYEAVQESLCRSVAIKTLVAHPLYRREQLRRFEREAQIIGALHHSNIVQVYGTGHQDGLHYFAMQLVAGKNLHSIIAARETQHSGSAADDAASTASEVHDDRGLGHRTVTNIGLQVAHALEYAHHRGVLHRDVKPSNLLLDSDGTVWITDFGLAKLFQEEGDVTRTGDVVGTLRYLPPEALHGQWDERGDVYGLGVTLYELLTLRPAFGRRNRAGLLDEITRGELQRPRKINPAIPLDLETIVLKAVEREPADRYQTAGQMAEDLRRVLDGEPIAARQASLLERALKWSRRKPALAALVFVMAFLAFVGFPTLALLWRQAETASQRADSEWTKAEAAREDAEALTYAQSMSLAQIQIEKLNASEARKLLEGVRAKRPPKPDSRSAAHDRRGWEWNFLWQQLDSSLMTLAGHSGPVLFVAIRPDDAQIATVGGWEAGDQLPRGPGEVILWDARTGRQQHVLGGHRTRVSGAGYSPDGQRLATISIGDERAGENARIHIWDTETGVLLHTIHRPAAMSALSLAAQYKPILAGVQYSRDGRWLVCWPRPVEVRRTDTFEPVWTGAGMVASVLPGADRFLRFQVGTATLHELATGKLVASTDNRQVPFDLAFSTDGKQFSALISSVSARLWSLPDLSVVRDVSVSNAYWCAITPDGERMVFGDRRGALHVRSLTSAPAAKHYLGHAKKIVYGAHTHDGQRVVTAGSDGTARIWSLTEAQGPRVVETRQPYDRMGDISFSSDGDRVLFVSRWHQLEGGAYGWAAVKGDSRRQHRIDTTAWAHWPRTDFAFSHHGQWMAAPARQMQPREPPTRGYAPAGEIKVWSTSTGKVLQAWQVGQGELTSLAWSRGDALLAVATYQNERSQITLFQHGLASGDAAQATHARPAPSAQIELDDQRITALCFAPRTRQLAVSTARGVYLLDRNAGSAVRRFEQPESAAFLDYDPAGQRLAAAYPGEQRVRVFNTITGELAYEVDAPRAVACVRFSPNGRRLAMVGYDSLIYFCDAEKGYRLITLSGAQQQVGTVSFTPRVVFSRDGRRLATNDWQGRITIWEAE